MRGPDAERHVDDNAIAPGQDFAEREEFLTRFQEAHASLGAQKSANHHRIEALS